MPRSLDIILRGDIVDHAKPGDKAIFTGKLVVVPDIVQLLKPGEKYTSQNVDTTNMKRNEGRSLDAVSGLRKIGVKDLSYKLVFIACSVHAGDTRFGFTQNQQFQQNNGEMTTEEALAQFSSQEKDLAIDMKNQDDLYTKLANSIAPNIHGHLDVKKGILLQLFGGI